jgi:hypothetical protein
MSEQLEEKAGHSVITSHELEVARTRDADTGFKPVAYGSWKDLTG